MLLFNSKKQKKQEQEQNLNSGQCPLSGQKGHAGENKKLYLVLPPHQAAKVEAPGIHGDALLRDSAHHHHDVVRGARHDVVIGHQGSGVMVTGHGGGAFLHGAGQHLGPALLGHRVPGQPITEDRWGKSNYTYAKIKFYIKIKLI